MDYKSQSNDAILADLGDRLRRLRLNADISQETLAEITGLSRKTIQNAESGHNSSLDTVVSLLRGLNALDQLDNFLPNPGLSPVQLAKLQGKTRQRASGQRQTPSRNTPEDNPGHKGKKGGWQW